MTPQPRHRSLAAQAGALAGWIVLCLAGPLAALLLVPYLAWVTFAAALNFWRWRANPALLG